MTRRTRWTPARGLALAAGWAAGCDDAVGDAAHVVYVDFADGSEGLAAGDEDDAVAGVSQLCEAQTLGAFVAPAACAGGRAARCEAEVVERVAAYYAGFDIAFTRDPRALPEDRPYAAVIVAPPHPACSFGQRGVAFVDCEDENPASLGLVFDCYADADACAVLIAHEVAHGLGLGHVEDPRDIMAIGPDDPTMSFRSTRSPTVDEACGAATQSSRAALDAVLGPAHDIP